MATHQLHYGDRLPCYLAVSRITSRLAAGLLLTSLLAPLAAAQWSVCGKQGNYTANSTYQANIKSFATTLPKDASSSGTLFATNQTGADPDKVYALALCRGDINASACSGCIDTALQDAQQLCAFSKNATVLHDNRILGYSNRNFIPYINGAGGEFIILKPVLKVSNSSQKYQAVVSVLDNGDSVIIARNAQNVSAPFKVFDDAVGVLLDAAADYAATNSSRRFATAVEGFQTSADSNYPRLYGLAQCKPDMMPADCRSCLSGILQSRLKYFSGNQGGRIAGLRCNYRYEPYQFFSGKPLLELPEPSIGAPALALVNATLHQIGRGRKINEKRIALAITLSVGLYCYQLLLFGSAFRGREFHQ